jgi:UDP-galactopyranose mutase
MKKKYDYVIVGSGLFGSVFAYLATQDGKKCLVIDKRTHRGGNVYCENVDNINVHKYGAHIFHTSDKKIWDFVNNFVPFNRYINTPLANYHGNLYNLPFNMNTFVKIWGIITPKEAIAKIESEKKRYAEELAKKGIKKPRNLEEQALLLVGKDIYNILIKDYTEKQWGRKCINLPSSIIKRLPLRFTFDNNYFDDLYQGIPIGGYNKLIDGLLKDVETITDTDFFKERKHFEEIGEKIVYTGQIDEYFDYSLGNLEWRSLNFKTNTLNIPNYQGNAVINYTDSDTEFTRIIEHKHFEVFGDEIYDNPKTIITKEYPIAWKKGMIPYYPINDEKNAQLFEEYRKLAKKEKNVIFGGRLGEYKYYDMDDVIESAMKSYSMLKK